MTDRSANSPTYSLVIPVYNEEQTLPELRGRLGELMDRLDGPCEVILVDDGSSDGSYAAMREIHAADRRFKVVHFSRNFGHQIAVTAGIEYASGEAVVIMDADLQDPPEVVEEMAARWREGYEVVYGVRASRDGESWLKRSTAAGFYRVLKRLSATDMPVDAGDFRLVDRKAIEAIKAMPENSRYLRGMFAWIGFRQAPVHFRRDKRFAGDTKYPLGKMLKLAADGILSFSNAPLRLALWLGLLVAGVSIIYGIVAIILQLSGATVPGWASIIVVVSFLGGVQLIVLGVIGEYLGRMYDEVRGRPLFIVRATHGFDDEDQASSG